MTDQGALSATARGLSSEGNTENQERPSSRQLREVRSAWAEGQGGGGGGSGGQQASYRVDGAKSALWASWIFAGTYSPHESSVLVLGYPPPLLRSLERADRERHMQDECKPPPGTLPQSDWPCRLRG